MWSVAGFVVQFGLLSILAIVVKRWIEYLQSRNMLKRIPGDEGSFIPLINGLRIAKKANAFGGDDLSLGLYRLRESYYRRNKESGIFKTWLGLDGGPFLHVYDPDLIQEIIKSPDFENKSLEYDSLHYWLGNALLTSNGDEWKGQRRMLTPAFHLAVLDLYEEAMNEHSFRSVRKMLDKGNELKNVELSEWTAHCAMSVLLETIMGLDPDIQQTDSNLEASIYINALNETAYRHTKRFANPFFKIGFLYEMSSEGKLYLQAIDKLHSFSKRVFDMKVAQFLEDPSAFQPRDGKKQPLMDMLIRLHLQEKKISVQELMEQVATFMFAGHDTTGWGVAWILYQLGLHTDVQAKVHEELDGVFGENRTRHVTPEDLKELPYFECVIREGQRLYGSVPFISRRCTKNGAKLGEYEIPEGATLALSLHWLHRDAKQFPDPERFDPERFLPENSHDRHPYAFMPFSTGPRNCIGQRFAQKEMRISLVNILRNFRVRSRGTLEDREIAGELILRAKNGLYADLEKR